MPRLQDSLHTVDGTGARLEVSRATVYRLLRDGELASVTIGRSRRIPESEINAFIERRRQLEGARGEAVRA